MENKAVIIDSITKYICTNAECRNLPSHVIYNQWAQASGILVDDTALVEFILPYIDDLKSFPEEALSVILS